MTCSTYRSILPPSFIFLFLLFTVSLCQNALSLAETKHSCMALKADIAGGGGCVCKQTKRYKQPECCCMGWEVSQLSDELVEDVGYLYLHNTSITEITPNFFDAYPSIRELEIDNSVHLEHIDGVSFTVLPKLRKLSVVRCPNLREISGKLLVNNTKIQTVILKNNGLRTMPSLRMTDSHHVTVDRIDLSQNKIKFIGDSKVRNVRARTLVLSENNLLEISGYAFTESQFLKLRLNNNPNLRSLSVDAFKNMGGLQTLLTMPRSRSNCFPSLNFGRIEDEDISDESVHEEKDESEVSFDSREGDVPMEIDMEGSCNSGSDISKRLKEIPDSVLTFLASACTERLTDAGFNRFLVSHNDETFKRQASDLWNVQNTSFNTQFICNGCGIEIGGGESCCGEKIKYLRIGGFSQLEDIVRGHLDDIKRIRTNLRNGTETKHNLTGSFLKKVWQSERGNELEISLIGSIDGVSLNGNSRKKIWPVTMIVVDLAAGEMQRAQNLVIHGLAEGAVNPSTVFWNKIVPEIYADIESRRTEISGKDVSFSIVSWVADQPAKRALFGMKGHNAESSCFFGLCTGTHHKKMAVSRHVARPGQLTEEDAQKGLLGFGPIPPKILEYQMPYDTVIDLLHNASEGIFPLIMKETLKTGSTTETRSDMFDNDAGLHQELCGKAVLPPSFQLENLTNCSEKLQYFRINFGLAGLCNPSLKPNARLVITSLMVLINGMYTNAPTPTSSHIVSLTAAARWALEKASHRYMTTKTHELLSHLPFVMEQFGNVGTLSTFAFEHFYKYSLKGFNAQKTKGFTEAVISRVILHSGTRREIQMRARNSPSKTILDFLSTTPAWSSSNLSWKNPIILKKEDTIPEIANFEAFATLYMTIGKLQSSYKSKKPNEETFFAENNVGLHSCFRFIAVCIHETNIKILCERIREVSPDQLFPLMKKDADEMDRPGNTYAFNVWNCLKRYTGLVHGKPSGELELLDVNAIRGIGGYMQFESSAYYLQLNGSCIHH